MRKLFLLVALVIAIALIGTAQAQDVPATSFSPGVGSGGGEASPPAAAPESSPPAANPAPPAALPEIPHLATPHLTLKLARPSFIADRMKFANLSFTAGIAVPFVPTPPLLYFLGIAFDAHIPTRHGGASNWVVAGKITTAAPAGVSAVPGLFAVLGLLRHTGKPDFLVGLGGLFELDPGAGGDYTPDKLTYKAGGAVLFGFLLSRNTKVVIPIGVIGNVTPGSLYGATGVIGLEIQQRLFSL